MTDQADNASEPVPARTSDQVACPFCAMLCDDLSLPVHSLPGAADTLACARARAGFSAALARRSGSPTIGGRETDWPQAVEHARTLLEASRLPLFHGLLGDLADAQGALRLAERYGGVIDHADGDAMSVNLAVYQDSGWICTSLGETRNRADLVVLIGERIDDSLPRLRERLFDVAERLHTDAPADIVTLSEDPLNTLDEVRTLLRERPLPSPSSLSVDLHERIRQCRYPVFVPLVAGQADAELIVRAAADLVRVLNEEHRAALLMMTTGAGGATAQHASTWHGGFGIRTSFAAGYPEQDLRRHAGHHLLAGDEADLLVWISTLDTNPPPPCNQPRIVIGHPATAFDDAPPDVFLPVAVPGVHRSGFIHRGDGLHMLPLQALLKSTLPGTRELVGQLLDTPAETNGSC